MLCNRESRCKQRLYIAWVKYKKKCRESMKDKFLTSVLFKFLYYSNLKVSTENVIS